VTPLTDSPILVPDRELDEEKKPGATEPPRIRCPLCGWSPRKEDRLFCDCGNEWNTFDTGGVCPAWLTWTCVLLLHLLAIRWACRGARGGVRRV